MERSAGGSTSERDHRTTTPRHRQVRPPVAAGQPIEPCGRVRRLRRRGPPRPQPSRPARSGDGRPRHPRRLAAPDHARPRPRPRLRARSRPRPHPRRRPPQAGFRPRRRPRRAVGQGGGRVPRHPPPGPQPPGQGPRARPLGPRPHAEAPTDPEVEIEPNEWPIFPRAGDEIEPVPAEESPHWRDRLVFDFDVSDASPVIKGTWITVGHVISLIVDGETWADILRSHPELTEADIRTCLAYTMAERRSLTATSRSVMSRQRGSPIRPGPTRSTPPPAVSSGSPAWASWAS